LLTNTNADPAQERASRAHIELRVMHLLGELFLRPSDEIALDADFEDLGADSVDLTELQIMLLQEFGIEIPERAVETIRSAEDLIDFISNHLHVTEGA
jgi:acyl carrier protein